MHHVLFFLLIFAPLSAAPAMAQSACGALAAEGCACAVPLTDLQGGVFGRLNPSGEVMVSGLSGAAPAVTPVNLAVGDSVVVLESGAAVLSAGPSCSLRLPSQSSLVIRAVGGCACASVVEALEQADDGEGGGGNGGLGAVITGTALAVGGGAATLLLLQEDDDDSVSP